MDEDSLSITDTRLRTVATVSPLPLQDSFRVTEFEDLFALVWEVFSQEKCAGSPRPDVLVKVSPPEDNILHRPPAYTVVVRHSLIDTGTVNLSSLPSPPGQTEAPLHPCKPVPLGRLTILFVLAALIVAAVVGGVLGRRLKTANNARTTAPDDSPSTDDGNRMPGTVMRHFTTPTLLSYWCVTVSPDGKQLYGGTQDGIQQWDIASGKTLRNFTGLENDRATKSVSLRTIRSFSTPPF